MPAYYYSKCKACGFIELRYRNSRKCRKCKGDLERLNLGFRLPWTTGVRYGKSAFGKTLVDSHHAKMAPEQPGGLKADLLILDDSINFEEYVLPDSVKGLIENERKRQIAKWGEQHHDDYHWLAILTEEVGELAETILHNEFGGHAAGNDETELIHCAAVCIQWLEMKEKKRSQDSSDETH